MRAKGRGMSSMNGKREKKKEREERINMKEHIFV